MTETIVLHPVLDRAIDDKLAAPIGEMARAAADLLDAVAGINRAVAEICAANARHSLAIGALAARIRVLEDRAMGCSPSG